MKVCHTCGRDEVEVCWSVRFSEWLCLACYLRAVERLLPAS
jgi:hypothetical protein